MLLPLSHLRPTTDLPQPAKPLGPWVLGGASAITLVSLAALQHMEALPSVWLCAVLGLAAGGFALLLGRWKWARFSIGAVALVGLALAWGSWRASERLQPQLPAAWEGRDLSFEARLLDLPQRLPGHGERPLLRLQVAPLDAAHDADGVQLQLPEGLSLWMEDSPTLAPKAGERWRFSARLKRVHALQNPGLPDAELWLLERGIGAQGNVRSAERLEAAPWWSLQAFRQFLRDRLDAWVEAPRARAVLSGLLLGDQASLSSNDWALLRDTGVVHLFSISGLHITGFAWLAALALGALWRRQPSWCLRLPAPLAARWGGVLLATGYALLAGWGVPAQRTVALLLLVALLQSSGRLWPWPLALWICALPIGLADPWALVQPGFWLSFVAVALLMQQGQGASLGGGEAAWIRSLRELLRTQAVVTLGLAPLLVLFFGQLSVVGVLANLVAVPVVTVLITPLALLGVLLPWAWMLAAGVTQLLFQLLGFMATWPGAVWSLPQAPFALQALALLGLLLAAIRLPRWLRAAGCLLVLPLFLYQPARPPAGHFHLRVFDVGQGSALWLQTATHDAVLDAGPSWGPAGGQDAGGRVLLPSLRAAGVRHLDVLVLSHGDADHSGGANSLRAGLPVAMVRAPRADGRLGPLRTEDCHAGLSWTWDGVRFAVLHPPPGQSARSPNAASCVLRVEAVNGASLLVPADLEAPEELLLLQTGAPLEADVLLLPHHGSQTSSSAAFLDAVKPQLALAQSGYRSRHGHPALSVQNRLRERGVPLLTSADCGAFDWDSRVAPSRAGCLRQQRARYWHQQFEPAVTAVDPMGAGPLPPEAP